MYKFRLILLLSSMVIAANAWATPIFAEFRQGGYQLTQIPADELELLNANDPLWDPLAIAEVWGSFTGEDLDSDGTISFDSQSYYQNYPSSELYSFQLNVRQIYPWSQTPIAYGFELSTAPGPSYAELLRSFNFDVASNALAYYADAPDPPAAGCNRAYRSDASGYFEVDCSLQYSSDSPIELNIVSNVPEPGALSLSILGMLSLCVASWQSRRNRSPLA